MCAAPVESSRSSAPQDADDPVDQLIDWDFAVRTAARLAGPGPQVGRDEAQQAVTALHEAARAAAPHIAEVTRLSCPADSDAVRVVDRRGWAEANVVGFRRLLGPALQESFARRGARRPPAVLVGVGGRVTGAEVGALLGFLASRVLGQYDPFSEPGRLLLVAPNVVHVERELVVDPGDFRLWVCLHEETHRVQFGANPWLAAHLEQEIGELIGELTTDPGQLVARIIRAARELPELLRGQETDDATSLVDLAVTPAQRERLARITAVMSLLEGHADVAMDAVGPDVVPTVATIRSRFGARRAGRGALDRVLRRLLGLDAKMRQYADGARFVREVTTAVGVDGFNRVWTGPQAMPTPAEMAEPGAWVRRVHG